MYLQWEEGGSKESEFISKPLGIIRSSLLILHLLYFPAGIRWGTKCLAQAVLFPIDFHSDSALLSPTYCVLSV